MSNEQDRTNPASTERELGAPFDETAAPSSDVALDQTAAPSSDVALDETAAPGSDVALDETAAPDSDVALDRTAEPAIDIAATAAPELAAASPAKFSFAKVGAGAYVKGNEIARGGMGRIVAAVDRRLGRSVALKELLTETPELAKRFEREAMITARLQHPSIVPVYEAGTWPTGHRFYAMRKVSGITLEEAIDKASDLRSRLALLPNAAAVVDAIAYAHDQRVIHRDLKPANVLVGPFGETVVIDWGLARYLDESEIVSEEERPLVDQASGKLTQAGAMMGTPAYMAPEQSRGKSVDERADVYALGAILYHLVSGVHPYQGSTSLAVLLERLQSVPPESLAELAPECPADLIAIVETAMAADPAERYHSAAELAADLKRYQSGRLVGAHEYSLAQMVRRWIRKHRAAFVAAIVSLLVIAAVGLFSFRRVVNERDRADEQRQAADTRRAAADRLVTFMLTDLTKKLEGVGRLEFLADVADATRNYDRETESIDGDDVVRMQRKAQLHRLSAFVAADSAELDQAIAHLREAADLRARVAGETPSDGATMAHAEAFLDLAERLVEAGRRDEALDVVDQARSLMAPLHEAEPADQERSLLLAKSLSSSGVILVEKREFDSGLRRFERARALLDKPTGAAALYEAGATEQAICNVIDDQTRYSAAEPHCLSAVGFFRELVKVDPGNAQYLDALRSTINSLGDVRRRLGKFDESDAAFREARELVQRLQLIDPLNMRWRVKLAGSEYRLAKVDESRKRWQEAAEHCHKAVAIMDDLVSRDTDNTEWLRNLSIYRARLGTVLLELNDTRGALTQFLAVAKLRDDLVAQAPSNHRWRRDRASARDYVGQALHRLGRYDEARKQYELALAELRELDAAGRVPARHNERIPEIEDRLRKLDAQGLHGGLE